MGNLMLLYSIIFVQIKTSLYPRYSMAANTCSNIPAVWPVSPRPAVTRLYSYLNPCTQPLSPYLPQCFRSWRITFRISSHLSIFSFYSFLHVAKFRIARIFHSLVLFTMTSVMTTNFNRSTFPLIANFPLIYICDKLRPWQCWTPVDGRMYQCFRWEFIECVEGECSCFRLHPHMYAYMYAYVCLTVHLRLVNIRKNL